MGKVLVTQKNVHSSLTKGQGARVLQEKAICTRAQRLHEKASQADE